MFARAFESRRPDGRPALLLELIFRENSRNVFLTGGGMGVTRLILTTWLDRCVDKTGNDR